MIDYNKFEGIILSAGLSTRMNDWKPKVEIGDVPILIRTIVPMVNICAKVIVVGGYNYNALSGIVENTTILSDSQKNKISFVENKNYLNGMLSSVKCGLQNITQNAEGVFLTLVDVPFALFSTYQKLIEYFSEDSESEVFIPVTLLEENDEEGKPKISGGHPVLIKSSVVNQIIKCKDDFILRDVLSDFKQKFCPVNDKGISMDIDNFSDLQAAKFYMENLKNLH
jgi:molybdenum cofactor cytidylyltransferase